MFDTEDTFDRIIQDAIQEMDCVQCSVGDYQDGLRAAIDELKIALEASIRGGSHEERD